MGCSKYRRRCTISSLLVPKCCFQRGSKGSQPMQDRHVAKFEGKTLISGQIREPSMVCLTCEVEYVIHGFLWVRPCSTCVGLWHEHYILKLISMPSNQGPWKSFNHMQHPFSMKLPSHVGGSNNFCLWGPVHTCPRTWVPSHLRSIHAILAIKSMAWLHGSQTSWWVPSPSLGLTGCCNTVSS